MPSTWRTVRVFLSSTFRDMHAERDHLIKVTFPSLRERLLPFRVELYDIDLRWGITEDEAKNEKVIGLCLEQVNECRPFFLAFLGHRYGWVPSQVPDETQQRFPFVSRFPGASVTELEIRSVVGQVSNLPESERQVGNLPHNIHPLILLRTPETIESIPEATRKRDFLERDANLRQKLEALRKELGAGPYPVQPYSAHWDPKRYDRVNRTEGKLVGLDDFGKQVEDWLWQAIQKELQLPDTPAEIDPLDAEADLHERFIELRTRIYVGRDDLYRRLRDFALDRGELPLLLTGESGLGKSAALARFVRDFRKEHPEVFVLAHFVGASPRTTSLAGMLDRLTQELQRKYNLTLPKAESPEEILRTFLIALTSLPESARVVLVFDALNQLDADSRAETLVWLPELLPANVRVLCSVATPYSPLAPYSGKGVGGEGNVPRVLTAFGDRQYVSVQLKPLGDEERRAIIQAVPRLVAKTLDDKQVNALLANPATQNPLFLMVALEELRGYGSYENLNKLIAKLPREGDALRQLFEQVFQRLEEEFNKPLVEWTLRLLACSRRGLSGAELQELTRNVGEKADDLYPVLRQLRPYLQVREGLFDFYHTSVRRAVEVHYLKWQDEEDQHDPWARWNAGRRSPASAPTKPEREARDRLIIFFEPNRLAPRSVDELPWQLAQVQSWRRLFNLLGELPFFNAAWEADEFEVRTTWSLVKNVGGLEPIDAYRSVMENPAGHDCEAVRRLGLYLSKSGHGEETLPVWSFLIKHYRGTSDDFLLEYCLWSHASVLMDIGKLECAMALHKEREAISRRINHPDGLQNSLGNQALILKQTGDYEGAMQLHKEQEEICRRIDHSHGLGSSLGNQAMILRRTGNLDGGMELLKQAEAIARRLNDLVWLAGTLGNQALILRDTGDLDGAMRLRREEEAISRRLNDPEGLARSLGNQAVILKIKGDLDTAMRLHKEEEVVVRALNYPEMLAHCLCGQARILKDTGDLEGAMRLHKEEEAICRRLNDPAGLVRSLGNQALVLRRTGDTQEAMRLHKEEEAIVRRLNDPLGLATCLGNQALIQMNTGDLESAFRLLDELESLCRRTNNREGLALCLANKGHILAKMQGRPTEGLPLLEEAMRIANEHGLTALGQKIEVRVKEIRGLVE